ncbi:hypothetical protein SOM11_12395 [Frigoribacterium sp. CFBP9039]|uniref:hypothetical protein n=1 Tax=Frigoribacterium TaxID=96492 RepID=UPI001FACBED1|nr:MULTISPECIES: hypothetical protein [Frigoribacterium]MCJ0700541.1 hypothetical protein [Frigoribacterium faeni]MDY0891412.1 hypothetical protein [Frigoribacterium sp. CFBP9030]MDY0946786.1 hypothetical protein [Frigoribacterium sp. CFBP9039]
MNVDENTLGVTRGRRAARGLPIGSTGARSLRQARAAGATLGTGHLGIGAAVLAGLQAVYGLIFFFSHLDDYPSVAPVLTAWLLYIAVFVVTTALVTIRGQRLTGRLFAAIAVVLALVVALDFVAIAPLRDVGAYATVSVAVGFGLLPIVTLRPAREIVVATTLLFAAFVAMTLATTPITADTGPQQIAMISLAVLPSAVATLVLQRFRRMVQVELDRVLVQSNVSQPRFAVGMLASDELARLDLAAEKLLDGVAGGDVPLPLAPKVASQAASLATELRLHLIEGRRETWLHHAVTESEYLGRSVTLADPSSLAGLLAPPQRDGLLQAVWLLLGDSKSRTPGTTITLTLGPVTATAHSLAGRSVEIPVVVATTGIRRNRVTPATWSALERVGEYTVSTHEQSVRLQVSCLVDNPAEL